MKRAYLICLFQLLTTTFLLSQSNPVPRINQSARAVSPVSASQADPKAQARILDGYGKLPLSFEANHGQADGRVKFLSRTGGYTLFLTGDEAVLALRGSANKEMRPQRLKPDSEWCAYRSAEALRHPRANAAANSSASCEAGLLAVRAQRPTSRKPRDVGRPPDEEVSGGVLRMKLRNASPGAKVTGMDELAGKSNYFIGNDRAKWRTGVPTYAKVKYEGIYSGIDLVYYGNQRQLEYDFIVAPGADPRRISFDVRGAKRIRQDARGELVFKVGEDEIRWHKPVVYQERDGTRQEVAARYAITDTNRVGFAVAKYDASKPLYIDPLIYSTYLGGSGYDEGFGIAVDAADNTYVTGFTDSLDFPVTADAYQTVCKGDPLGCGDGAIGDVFITKIGPTGSLIYSTYLGGTGTDSGYGIAVDNAGDAFVTGWTTSADFPLTPGAFDTVYCKSPNGNCGAGTAFVVKLNPTGSALVYSTYLSGSWWAQGNAIAVDDAGYAYVTGATQAPDFPTTPGAFQTVCGAGDNCIYYYDAFVSKIDLDGTALVYSTYLGARTAKKE